MSHHLYYAQWLSLPTSTKLDETLAPSSWNEQQKALFANLPFYVWCVNRKHNKDYQLTSVDIEAVHIYKDIADYLTHYLDRKY
jgi:hypothetical protein